MSTVHLPLAEVTVSTNGHILAIEDDAICAQLFAVVASQCGATCHQANTAAQARNELDRAAGVFTFDLVLLDGNLPDGNGLELAREFRAGLLPPHTPILAVSGHPIPIRHADLDGALNKPIEPDDLEQIIRSWLPAPTPIDWEILERLRKYQVGQNQNLIRELVDTYLRSCPERVLALDSAVQHSCSPLPSEERDLRLEEVRKIAHQLRGAAASVGATSVAHWAERVEQDPLQPRCLQRLKTEVERSRQAFRNYSLPFITPRNAEPPEPLSQSSNL